MSALLRPDDLRAAMLARGIESLGLDLDADQRQQLLDFIELIAKWNRVHNLTAIRDPDAMVAHHILDSLSVVPHLDGKRIADIGSGAGLPGIPVAVARPDCRVTLVESNGKKAAFLLQAVAELGLENVTVVAARAEDFRPAEGFDCVLARAFADLGDFTRATRHLLATGGALFAMKGAYPRAELQRLPAGMRAVETVKLAVPQLDAERHLVIVRAD